MRQDRRDAVQASGVSVDGFAGRPRTTASGARRPSAVRAVSAVSDVSGVVQSMDDVGLVLVEDAYAADAFTAAVVHGLEEYLIPLGVRLTTRVVRTREAELDAYRFWGRTRVVDAVVVLGAVEGDQRVPLLRESGLPFVVATDVQRADGCSAVVFDNAAMARSLLRFLAARGSDRVLYLPGRDRGDVSDLRAAAIADHEPGVQAEVLRTELEPGAVVAAVQAVRAARGSGPLALVFDDDAVTVAVIGALRQHGLRVPEEVAVICWTDSVLCQSSDPTVTAVNGRADEVGSLLGECLLKAAHAPVPHHPDRAATVRRRAGQHMNAADSVRSW